MGLLERIGVNTYINHRGGHYLGTVTKAERHLMRSSEQVVTMFGVDEVPFTRVLRLLIQQYNLESKTLLKWEVNQVILQFWFTSNSYFIEILFFNIEFHMKVYCEEPILNY